MRWLREQLWDEKHSRRVLLTASTVAAAVVLVFWWRLSDAGFDLSDEGYYVNSIRSPAASPATVTLFGFVYHPVLEWLHGDLVWLRRTCALLLVVSGGVLAWSLVRCLGAAEGAWSRSSDRLLFAMAAGPLTLGAYSLWLLTPNYNLLTLQGALATAIGLVWLVCGERRGTLLGVLVVAVGLSLAFCAKPSAALLLAILVSATVGVADPSRWRHVLVALLGSGGIVAAIALIIDGSLWDFVNRLRWGLADAKALGGGHTVSGALRWDDIPFEWPTWTLFGVGFLGAFSVGLLLVSRRAYAATSLLLLIAVLPGMWLMSHPLLMWESGIRTWFFAIIPLGFATALAAERVRHRRLSRAAQHGTTRDRRAWALTVGIALFPVACVFGTNNNYWTAVGGFGCLWGYAAIAYGISAAGETSRKARPLIASVLAMQAATMLIVANSAAIPYRQRGPVSDMATDVALVGIDSAETQVRVDDEVAHVIEEFKQADLLTPGTPIIDLSGESPGLVAAVGGVPVGAGWIIGGYAGSQTVARHQLGRISCATIARAWLLDAPESQRAIDASAIRESGLLPVSTFRVEASAQYRGQVIQLLAPLGAVSERDTECRAARGDG